MFSELLSNLSPGSKTLDSIFLHFLNALDDVAGKGFDNGQERSMPKWPIGAAHHPVIRHS